MVYYTPLHVAIVMQKLFHATRVAVPVDFLSGPVPAIDNGPDPGPNETIKRQFMLSEFKDILRM
jgi:hypothetical protein